MSALYVLLVVSLGVAVAFLAGFVWATRSGQFDDTQTPPMRLLGDEDQKAGRLEKKRMKTT